MATQMAAFAGIDSLNSSDTRYSALFHSAGEAMLLIGRSLVDCNARASALFRVPPDEILGRSIDEFFPLTQPDGKESRQASYGYFERAASGEIIEYKWQFQRPDQTVFNATVTLNVISVGAEQFHLAIIHEDSRTAEVEALLAERTGQVE